MSKDLKAEVITEPEVIANTNFEKIIYDLDNEIEDLTVRADKLDYFISISSGIICGMLNIFQVGEFSLEQGSSKYCNAHIKNKYSYSRYTKGITCIVSEVFA